MKKVLITGINGFLGQHLLHRLNRCNGMYHVFGIDRHDYYDPLFFNTDADPDYNSVNIADESEVYMLIRSIQPDVVIHLAALLGNTPKGSIQKRMIAVNIGGTLNLLNAIDARTHFIFPSTGLIYGNQEAPYREDMHLQPANFYALTKKLGEDCIGYYVHRHRIKATVFRPSVIYGPGQQGSMFIPSMVKKMIQRQLFPMTEGEQKRDFVYVGDVTRAILDVIRSSVTGTYNIGSGKAITMKDAAETIQRLCGQNNLIQTGSLPYREHECWNYSLSIDKAKATLNWSPQCSFEKGIKKVFTYEMAQQQ